MIACFCHLACEAEVMGVRRSKVWIQKLEEKKYPNEDVGMKIGLCFNEDVGRKIATRMLE